MIQDRGWLKDKYRLSWRIVRSAAGTMFGDKDAAESKRVMAAMSQMSKLDIEVSRRTCDVVDVATTMAARRPGRHGTE